MITSLGFSQGAAPTPPARNASDVVSVFSDAYTNIANAEFSRTGDRAPHLSK